MNELQVHFLIKYLAHLEMRRPNGKERREETLETKFDANSLS